MNNLKVLLLSATLSVVLAASAMATEFDAEGYVELDELNQQLGEFLKGNRTVLEGDAEMCDSFADIMTYPDEARNYKGLTCKVVR